MEDETVLLSQGASQVKAIPVAHSAVFRHGGKEQLLPDRQMVPSHLQEMRLLGHSLSSLTVYKRNVQFGRVLSRVWIPDGHGPHAHPIVWLGNLP